MADPLIQAGNQATASVAPTLTPDQQSLSNNQNIPAGQPGSPWTAPTQNSTTPPVLTPTQAFNNTPVPVPSVTSPDQSGSLLASGQQTAKSVQDYVTQLTPPPTTLDKSHQDLLDSISTLTGQDTGKAQAQIDAEKASGATQDQSDLTALNNRLLNANASYEKQFTTLGGSNGAVETNAVLTAQQAGLRQAQAADIGLITAQIQAKQGDLTLALNTASRAVDAKYSTIEDQIKTKLAQLQALQPQLDQQQKVQSLAQQQFLQDQAQKVADEKADSKTNLASALSQGVTSQFANQNGKFFDARTGKTFATPQDFFQAAGVSSFEEAYQKGLVTDITQDKIDERNMVQQAAVKYPDAGIKSTDTLEQVQQKLANSRIYRKETYIAPPAGAGGGGVYIPGANPAVDGYITAIRNGESLTSVPAALRSLVVQGLNQSATIVDPNTDAQVRQIIASNPGEYGHAADAINKLQPGLASKYDTQLKAVYNDKQDVNNAFTQNTYTALAGSRFSRDANAIAKNFLDLPQYKLTAGGLPYIQKIGVAIQTPGSVSDQELLDSYTKLSNAGNAITDAQVRIITDGKSYSDTVNTFANKLKNGGVLSDNQRQQLYKLANETFNEYKKGYQPVYDQVTKQFQDAGIPKAFWTIPDLNTITAQGQGNQSAQQLAQQKGYNYQAMKDAGYSDQDIINSLK